MKLVFFARFAGFIWKHLFGNNMKNQLEIFLENNQMDAKRAMNELQAECVISDNCVTAADVANCKAAIKFLIQPKNKN